MEFSWQASHWRIVTLLPFLAVSLAVDAFHQVLTELLHQ